MSELYKCPVCGKQLTKDEYIKALGLWEEQQRHIKHLQDEQRKLKDKEKLIQSALEKERKKFKEQEVKFKLKIEHQEKRFKAEQIKLIQETKKKLAEQEKKSKQKFEEQLQQVKRTYKQKIKTEIKKGIEDGIAEQKKQFKKQEEDLKRARNKMKQLENSLKVSAKKYEQAHEEIKKLKEQIEKGITPQIEGLLEESKLLAKLKELYPNDRFDHPGKGGDIIQYVMEHGKEIGIIVYECKKVKSFNIKHIDQAKEARRKQEADFAILVTNAFPSKKQYYFVEKTVFVISPINLEPITYTLRESLVKMALLKITNEAKQKAVQRVYDYLSSSEYSNKMNDVASQLKDLAEDLKAEIKSHKDRWEKRYSIYHKLYEDVGHIDFKLKSLLKNRLDDKETLLETTKTTFVTIKEF